ncbi:MAG: periplasmic heavy metal sensor [Burkholderiales bacterium]
MKSRIPRLAGIMAAALFALGTQVALAQPGGGPGGGPGHPGPGRGFEIEHVLASLKTQLNLNTQQQATWDAVVAHGKTARQNARAAMDQVHAVMTAELAKAEPNFAAVAAAADAAQGSAQAERKQVRDEWLALYATFTPAQKAIVRDAVKQRVERMDAFRDRMKERFQQRQGNG